jgi:hypothetical protein
VPHKSSIGRRKNENVWSSFPRRPHDRRHRRAERWPGVYRGPAHCVRAGQAAREDADHQEERGQEARRDGRGAHRGDPVTIAPKDLAWGIDKKKLATIYDKVIDEDYKPKYQKTQPGPALDRLDAEVAERKAEFRRSEIQFGNVATGMDQTNLKGEFTYGNKEHLLSIDRGGKTRYFFFIGDKMWKVVDAIKLGEKSQWGKTFDDAVAILNKHYGVAGRARPADDAAGRPFAEVDWKDTKFQVRAVNWDDGTFGLVFQDPVTVANLPTLRKAATATAKEIDAKVKDAAAKKPEQAPPPKKK